MLGPTHWLTWLTETDLPATGRDETDPLRQEDIARMSLRMLADLPLQRPQPCSMPKPAKSCRIAC